MTGTAVSQPALKPASLPIELTVLPHLSITPLQLVLRFDTAWQGPALKTLLLRSGLGFHLRLRECLTGAANCEGCARAAECWYALAFETPRTIRPPAALNHGDLFNAHPFYLVSAPLWDRRLAVGAALPCLLTLFGGQRLLLPKLLGSLQEAGSSGRWGGRFHIESVVSPLAPHLKISASCGVKDEQVDLPEWRLPEIREVRAARIRTISPFRIRRQGHLDRHPSFEHILRALLRRVHLLAALYSDVELQRGWTRHYVEQAAAVRTVNASWHYVRQDRHSGRQQRTIPLDGVLGEMTVAGELGSLLGLLEAGRWTGLGASTGHGFGAYALEWLE